MTNTANVDALLVQRGRLALSRHAGSDPRPEVRGLAAAIGRLDPADRLLLAAMYAAPSTVQALRKLGVTPVEARERHLRVLDRLAVELTGVMA